MSMMNYSRLMCERIACFLKTLSAMPSPHEVPAELLVMSAGRETGNFSYRHVFADYETVYFIFRKSDLADSPAVVWECTDRELEMLAKEHGAVQNDAA